MILDHHYVPNLSTDKIFSTDHRNISVTITHSEHIVEATSRICCYQCLQPDELHHPHRHSCLPEGISLVGVESSLHDQDRDAIEQTKQKTTNMTFNGILREPSVKVSSDSLPSTVD